MFTERRRRRETCHRGRRRRCQPRPSPRPHRPRCRPHRQTPTSGRVALHGAPAREATLLRRAGFRCNATALRGFTASKTLFTHSRPGVGWSVTHSAHSAYGHPESRSVGPALCALGVTRSDPGKSVGRSDRPQKEITRYSARRVPGFHLSSHSVATLLCCCVTRYSNSRLAPVSPTIKDGRQAEDLCIFVESLALRWKECAQSAKFVFSS